MSVGRIPHRRHRGDRQPARRLDALSAPDDRGCPTAGAGPDSRVLDGKIDAHATRTSAGSSSGSSVSLSVLDASVAGVIHLNKAATTDVIARVSGSIGFVNTARSVLFAGPDPPTNPLGPHPGEEQPWPSATASPTASSPAPSPRRPGHRDAMDRWFGSVPGITAAAMLDARGDDDRGARTRQETSSKPNWPRSGRSEEGDRRRQGRGDLGEDPQPGEEGARHHEQEGRQARRADQSWCWVPAQLLRRWPRKIEGGHTYRATTFEKCWPPSGTGDVRVTRTADDLGAWCSDVDEQSATSG